MSQAGWAGTGRRPKANTRGLCRAWGTGDPEVAEVSFVPRACDRGGSEFWQPRACWEARPSCRQTPPRPHCAAQPASSCPFGVILLLALCRNPAPGHTHRSCTVGGCWLSPSIHSAGQSGLASSLGCKAPVGRPSVRVLTGWGPRWPTVVPSEASAQVCSHMSTHQASWGRGCPGPGHPRRQPKPGSCDVRGAGQLLVLPPPREHVVGMVHRHERLPWAFSGWQSYSGAVWW